MPILSTFAQNPVKEAFMKISFFANDFALYICFNKSKNAMPQVLNHCNFHWFLLLDGRDILYACIAFCAERIDVYPVLFLATQLLPTKILS